MLVENTLSVSSSDIFDIYCVSLCLKIIPPAVGQILVNTPDGHADHSPLREALERAEELCFQVNEGVREKENSDRLELIQSHIQCEGPIEVNTIRDDPCLSTSNFLIMVSEVASPSHQNLCYVVPKQFHTHIVAKAGSIFHWSRLSLTASFLSSSRQSQLTFLPSLFQHLVFNSLTNCLGPRKLLHSGRLYKTKSSRELWAFLFNDFLLLTHSTKSLSSSGPDKLFSPITNTNIQLKIYKAVSERQFS